jgi:NADPH:quinone reductase
MSTRRGRAVRFEGYGGRDVLQVVDVDVPPSGPGEVLVRVQAAGINPGEAAIRTGALHERFPATFPSGQGSDLAGVVEEVGEGVAEWVPGDEVLGWSWARSSTTRSCCSPDRGAVAEPSARARGCRRRPGRATFERLVSWSRSARRCP